MSQGLTDLADILASMRVSNRGDYVYVRVAHMPEGASFLAAIAEEEGLSLVIPVGQARDFGADDQPVFSCLTLDVHSALESVGLTKTVSAVLADHGIACNIIAGYYHDHLLVPREQASFAQELLEQL